MQLTDKVALITGGAKRVGKALALALAKEGCHIVVHYGRSAEEAEETVAELKSHGVEAWKFSANLFNEDAVTRMIPIALEKAGQLDILINSASIFSPEAFLEATPESWDKNMMIHMKAPFLLSQAFVKQLPEDRQGKIINMLDVEVLRPKNKYFSYTLSKYGLYGLTQMTAHAVAERNIQVNGIALGAIMPNVNEGNDASSFEKLARHIPAGKTGDVAYVVEAMLYLTKHADYVTGEVVRVDGGKHLV